MKVLLQIGAYYLGVHLFEGRERGDLEFEAALLSESFPSFNFRPTLPTMAETTIPEFSLGHTIRLHFPSLCRLCKAV